MELTGKVVNILPEQSGASQKGGWRKQDYVVETPGQYPKKVCLTVWGDKIDEYGLKEGDMINAQIDIESREYNGRWYTDVKAWKIDKEQESKGSTDYVPQENIIPPSAPLPDEEDDLPF